MKSRVHPKYKTKYHVQNWTSYDRALVRRGDLTIWLSPAAIAAWVPDGAGTPARRVQVRIQADRRDRRMLSMRRT